MRCWSSSESTLPRRRKLDSDSRGTRICVASMRTVAPLAFDPGAFVAQVATGKTTREYRGKQTIFSQGDPADAVFFPQAGKIKLTVVSTRGKEAVIGVLDSGSFFGEGCLAGQPLRMSTAT